MDQMECKDKKNLEKDFYTRMFFVRLIVCGLSILILIFTKFHNEKLYNKVKGKYLDEYNIEIINGKEVIGQLSSSVMESFDFLRISTLEIFRSVTS